MVRPRATLNDILDGIVGEDRSYFQPPENIKLKYPCIVYEIDEIDTQFANDLPFAIFTVYSVTYITRDPDDAAVGQLLALRGAAFSRRFTTAGLHHTALTIAH